MNQDDGFYDLRLPAAVAAHDQAASNAREILRTCKRFLIIAQMPDGGVAFGGSANLQMMIDAEMMIHFQAVRLLEAEYELFLEEGEET